MIVVYILLGILAVFLLYICFLAICSLFVDPKKEYTKNSRFYRVLLNSASAAALKFLRIRDTYERSRKDSAGSEDAVCREPSLQF